MKTLRSALVALVAIPLVALAGEPAASTNKQPAAAESPCDHPAQPEASAAPQSDWKLTRGEAIKSTQSMKVADLLAKPQEQDGKTVLIEGQVRKACERKGCWMELATSKDAKGPGVRVTFKDYGFFVPKDSAGATAVMEGVFNVKTIPEKTAKHYAGETPGGKPEAIKGGQKELSLVASGVELSKPSR